MIKLHVEQRKIGLSILFVFAIVEIDKPTRKMLSFRDIWGGIIALGTKMMWRYPREWGRFWVGISMVGNPF